MLEEDYVTLRYQKIHIALIILALVLGAVIIMFAGIWNSKIVTQSPRHFVVSSGESVREIAENLASEGYISKPALFRAVVRITGNDRNIKAGKYEIEPGMVLGQFVNKALSGVTPDSVSVLIKEGSDVESIETLLFEAGIESPEGDGDSFSMKPELERFWFLRDLPTGASLIGYLFPDTYVFTESTNPLDVRDRLLSNMEHKLATLGIEAEGFRNDYGLNLREIVTLASIVQNESVKGEMAIIAGVFVNRLAAGWRLESDATVNFALGTSKLVPSIGDVRTRDPYNTYLLTGLPPGPISNPGMEALRAAISPAKHDYFFFLHTPEGKTILSETYEEHLAARTLYWE